MPHVVIADPIHPDGVQRLIDASGLTLNYAGQAGCPALAEQLRTAEAVIVRGTRVDSAFLAMAPRLRMVCRHGVGYDLVDVPAATRAGVAVMITPEANAASVAEHALMLMLAVSRRVLPVAAGVRAGQWRVQGQSHTFELGGRRVLVVGFGRIGTRVARLCATFGMQVLVHDPFIPAGTIRGAGYEVVKDRDAGLAVADVVTLHLPASEATRGMVEVGFLAAMKPGAVLINTARGTLVDEAALEAALRSGHLGGAGLDVLRVEPMREPPGFLSLENVVVTPHVAASTAEGLRRMAWDAAGNVIDFLEGRPDRDAVVNLEALDDKALDDKALDDKALDDR
ncbi:hydroxyacid dehydrogenase [Bradyrhizobium sp. LHD-71]|uniref:hydroxyacid dehydrogenase n=1 Tax=Bradyrhizobium sp. LHD-71 TaxID=3072141 RepID=UPI00280D5FE9|nr:hydroxyacid dehydrogenase [Bradyrhizobium sp. LHD-71]MDQ8726958.1 hydroxyacid dehydrogenase [Bradyrhizobium sp. LHD-71]